MRFSVSFLCPSVLSLTKLKLQKTSVVKTIFKQEKLILKLTFNPGLAVTGFRTTRPRCIKSDDNLLTCSQESAYWGGVAGLSSNIVHNNVKRSLGQGKWRGGEVNLSSIILAISSLLFHVKKTVTSSIAERKYCLINNS